MPRVPGSLAGEVSIIIEPAHPARIAPLLMAAYGLTEREQEVTRLVLQCGANWWVRSASPTMELHVRDNERRALTRRPLG